MRRPLPRRRSAYAALVAVPASLLSTIVMAGPAAADEVYDRPASGVFQVLGHGWGHGHGLSQWGAQGAATEGVGADQITATYYPGTARGVLPAAPIRVLLQSASRTETQVYAATGLKVTDLSTGASEVLPSGASRWRATVDAAGLRLSSLTGSTWTPASIAGSAAGANAAYAGPLSFSGPDVVRLAYPDGTSRDYRGAVESVASTATTVQTVDVLSMEDYLLGVVPREASSSWRPAALQAQAIAARSYSAYERTHASGSFDICDSTQCQVFGGTRIYASDGSSLGLEDPASTDAVHQTTGVVRTYNGAPIFAQFSSSNGGWSTDGGQPYLVAQRDDWDGAVPNPVHAWSATLQATDIERRYPSLGTLQRIRVTARDGHGEWGGRVRNVVLEGVSSSGAATSVTTTGAGIYYARTWPAHSDGLRSSWWTITTTNDSAVVSASAAPGLVRPPGTPSTGRLTVTMRNTGTAAWPTDGLHMAVASPAGQADALVGGSTRPGVLVPTGARSIAPGQSASFTFALDAAGVAAGDHGRAYRLQIGDGPTFGAVANWTIPVAAPRFTAAAAAKPTAAHASTTSAPSAVFPDGRTVVVARRGSTTVRLDSRNTGNVTWPVGSAISLLLGTSGPRDRSSASSGPSWLSADRATRLAQASPVAPGGVGAFDLTLYGADKPVGVSTESFEPVWDGVHWIDGDVTTLSVVRVDPSVSRLAQTATALPLSVRMLDTANGPTLVVRLRNLGGAPWQVGKEWLATSSGRPDPLRASSWPYPTRPPAMVRNASRPGVSAVYPGEIGEWHIPLSALRVAPGRYLESWQAIGPTGRFGPVLRTTVTVVRR